jgi:hypothetical protein
MNALLPLMIHSVPSSLSRAVVRVPPASEPAPGSVSPNAASLRPATRSGRYFCFCSSVPNLKMGIAPSEIAASSVIATDESMRAISSIAMQWAR